MKKPANRFLVLRKHGQSILKEKRIIKHVEKSTSYNRMKYFQLNVSFLFLQEDTVDYL